jgi:hypothetical protein
MIIVRLVAVLVIVAFVLVLVFLWSRDRRYLRWAWRVFLIAIVAMLGLMLFYFVERLVFAPTALRFGGGGGLG